MQQTTKKRFRAIFHGCRKGAIGLHGFQCVDVDADEESAVRLKLYDTHDHITNLWVEELTK